MIGWLVTIGYVSGGIWSLPRIYRVLADEDGGTEDDAFGQYFMAFLSLIIAVLWPLVLAAAWVRKIATADRERKP